MNATFYFVLSTLTAALIGGFLLLATVFPQSAGLPARRSIAGASSSIFEARSNVVRVPTASVVEVVPLELPTSVVPETFSDSSEPSMVAESWTATQLFWDEKTEQFQKNFDSLKQNLMRYSVESVAGAYRLDERQVLLGAGLLDAPWMWETSPERLEERIKSLPWVETATVRMHLFPVRLAISIRESEPWMVAEHDGHTWLISSSGKLLQTIDSMPNNELALEIAELPRLSGLEPLPDAGHYLGSANARFLYAVKLLRFVELAGGLPFEFDRVMLLKNGGVRITPVSTAIPEVVLSASSLADAEHVLSRLGQVLKDLASRGEQAKLIDLRYRNQAVVR